MVGDWLCPMWSLPIRCAFSLLQHLFLIVLLFQAALLFCSDRARIFNLGNDVCLSREMDLMTRADEELLKAYPFLKQILEKIPTWKLPSSLDRVYDCKETFLSLNWRPVFTPDVVGNLVLEGKIVPW